ANSSLLALTSTVAVLPDVPGAPVADALTTTDPEPTITGSFDAAHTAGLSVTVDGVTYVLGSSPALTTSGNHWMLNLGVAGQSLIPGSYVIAARATDSLGRSTSSADAGQVTINGPVTLPPQASGGTSSIRTSTSGQSSSGAEVSSVPQPGGDSISLKLPVDNTVPAADLKGQAGVPSQSAATFSAPTMPDLNALPATAAGPSDLLGFPVARLSSAEAVLQAAAGSGPALGGHRLFVFHGIPNMQLTGEDTGTLRVPEDAFAHTDPAAIVHLEARMADGTVLPSWLSFEGVRGIFAGHPPEGLQGSLEIEVIARDTEGREAHTKFVLLVEDLRSGRVPDPSSADAVLGLDVDKKEAEKARLEGRQNDGRPASKPGASGGGKAQKEPAASFSEQLRAAKASRDPLLDKIARADVPKGPTRR
ncbi:MAG: hypothetical protein JO035_06835, partial [Betaproteobacteria bacterium]|nr:hypothetical protein [Betaproteobacteria bacterium]